MAFRNFRKRTRRAPRFRRRRTGSRFRRTGRRTVSYTDQRGVGSGLKFRSKRMGLRKWRNILWRDTMASAHYRSNDALVFTLATGIVQGESTLAVATPLLGVAGTTPFWTVAGGAVPIDTGAAVPEFLGDITLRGGKIGVSIAIPGATTDSIMARVWFVQTLTNPDFSIITGSHPMGFDPSILADFSTGLGRVIDFKEAILSSNNLTFTYERRLRTAKFDQVEFGNQGKQPIIIIQVINLTSVTSVVADIVVHQNVSFSADASNAAA